VKKTKTHQDHGGTRLNPDQLIRGYNRAKLGAFIRAGASFFIWIFAFAAYCVDILKNEHIFGISSVVLILIIINVPYLLILRKTQSRRIYEYLSIFLNLLEVIGYTTIIYFLGGPRALYLSPIYAVLIAYLGVIASPRFPFVVAGFSSGSLGAAMALEYYGFLPHMDLQGTPPLPGPDLFAIVLAVSITLFVIAFLTSTMVAQLKKNREKLQKQYTELEAKAGEIELADRELRKTHQELEKRVEERTFELREAVNRLQDEIRERQQAEQERGKLEAHLREVQKLESLGVLAGGIAHDFNNLLMAILGNADLTLLSLSPVSPARPNVEEIVRASQRAAELCRQMLAYSGKGRFIVGPYDLSEIVREMSQMLEVSISKKATLRYFFGQDLPLVNVDSTQIRQIIMNLITNASESLGDRSGFISVSTGFLNCDRTYLSESYLDDKLPEGKYVYLEVSDTGCGMDAETRSRIFDPFFTTKFTGRGLGLAAVLGIVRGHKGALKVYSEPGKGTTFKILLPTLEWSPNDREPVLEPSAPLPDSGTVLLVDDDPLVREVGEKMLVKLGFQVLTAADGREGLEVFRTHKEAIDCVLLDLTMPKMDGEEAFQELSRLKSDVKVILSSGYNEQNVIQQFAGNGPAGFIQKPYTLTTLREALSRVLG